LTAQQPESPGPALHRLARSEDLDAVFALYMHERVIPFLGFDPMPRAEFAEHFAAWVADGNFHVVEHCGALAGFYRITRREGRARHVALLGTLAVAPALQGGGFAMAMLESVLAGLQADGVGRVELSLEADNPRALVFYRKLGFELEGRQRAAYWRSSDAGPVDELCMARLLPPLV
jgi:putative acetyltransferase